MAKLHNLLQKKRNWQKRTKNVDLKGLGFRGLKPKNCKILTKFAKFGFIPEKKVKFALELLQKFTKLPNMQKKKVKFCKLKGFRV